MHYTHLLIPNHPPLHDSPLPACSSLQHYQEDADGLVCQLKHPVKKTSGGIEYTVSVQDFKESMFNLEGEILPIGS